MQEWPKGAVCTQTWLNAKGYSANLMRRYRASNWVKSIGSGAYILANDKVEWTGGLYALQSQLSLSVHAGGRTALEYHGAGHYARFQDTVVHLFAEPLTLMPKWFLTYPWGPGLWIKKSKFLPFNIAGSFSEIEHKEFAIRISAPERAILEMLTLVPAQQGFDEAFKIIENALTLRPSLMQELLRQCDSIKVKRLFLYMAEKAQLTVADRLLQNAIDLGQGKRVIVKNGRLDQKYLISFCCKTNDINH